MARRVSFALVALFLLARPSFAQTSPPSPLVSYSFDDNTVATGPDTFRVFQNAKGFVRLSSSNRFSGYRSIEIHDVAGDKDFPELQGYFPVRTRGKLFLHFALTTTDPAEEFNIALAGPAGFKLARGGIGFWLKTLEGYLCHYSDSMPKKLFRMQPFAWYLIDAVYDIDRGVYDLTIHEQGKPSPIVELRAQRNAPNQRGSSVDKFSFIGDNGTDDSNVDYYVDDIIVSVDAPVSAPLFSGGTSGGAGGGARFAAPGRRKLFVDYWIDQQRVLRSQPRPLPAVDFADYGLSAKDIQSLRAAGLWEAWQRALDGHPSAIASEVSPENRRFFEVAALWSEGTAALNGDSAEVALKAFEDAARLVPEGKIYELNAILSLAALGRWREVDARLVPIYGEWRDDMRLPAAMAMIGFARKDLLLVEQWLRDPAEQVPDELGRELLERLRRDQLDASLLEALRQRFPDNWDDYIRDMLVADQYFYVLIWEKQYGAAEQFGLRMVDRYRVLGTNPSGWIEKLGDADFMRDDLAAALRRYQESLSADPDRFNARVLQKMSDVYFRFGDFENERVYREKVYGHLETTY